MLLLIASVFLFKNGQSQNLIRNGSFENYHTPINWNWWGGDFIGYYSNPADTVMIDWSQYDSPDFFISACTHTYSGVPINLFGENYAKNGNNYIGIVSYLKGGNLKEYIYQKLTTPLQSGKIYCLSFYASKSDRVPYAIKNIGAYFSLSIPTVSNGHEINASPQVVNTGGFISDTIQWTQIQGCFTANGGEQYITIGNFTANANTDTLNVGTNNQIINGENEAYYYIDDITLIDQNTVGFNELSNGVSVNIFPNPATDVVNFQFSDANTKRKIELYNTIGELVLTEDASTQNSSLKTHHLQSGIYFYRILVGETILKTDKIVVIK